MRYEKRHQKCRDLGHTFMDSKLHQWRSGDLAFEVETGALLQLIHWCSHSDPFSAPWMWERMSDEYSEYAEQKEVVTFIDE